MRISTHHLFSCCLLASLLPAAQAWSTEAPRHPGIDEKGLNRAVLPGDDFYEFANGGWLAATEIPADRGSWSPSAEQAEATNQQIVALIEAAAKDRESAPSMGRLAADYYRAFMDEAAIEAKGLAPLRTTLKKSRLSTAGRHSLARWARVCGLTWTR